eukprot:COSAG05_NODE_68_length_22188_cov_8.265019_13_plen_395_part_00
MCREKALRSGAIVWKPAVGAGAASERPKTCAAGREEYNSARLARLVQLAWEQDDPGKLSRVLALLEEHGLPLSRFKAFFGHAGGTVPQTQLPPRIEALLAAEDSICFVKLVPGAAQNGSVGSAARPGPAVHFCSRQMEETFGVTAVALDNALDQMTFLTSFIEPGDLASGWPDYERVLARKDAAVASLRAVQTGSAAGAYSVGDYSAGDDGGGGNTLAPSAHGASSRWLHSFEGAPQPIRLSRLGAGVFWPHMFRFILDIASDGTETHTFLYTPLHSHSSEAGGGTSSGGASTKVHKATTKVDKALKAHAQSLSKRRRVGADSKSNSAGDVNVLAPPSVPSAMWMPTSSLELELALAEVLADGEDMVPELLCSDLVDPNSALEHVLDDEALPQV